MLMTVLLAGLLLVAIPVIIPLLLGQSFVPAEPIMAVLVLAQIPLAGIVILTQSLIGAGVPGKPLVGELAAMTVTAVTILVLLPLYGPIAAAVANLIGNFVSLAVLIYLVRKHINREPVARYVFIGPKRAIQTLRSR